MEFRKVFLGSSRGLRQGDHLSHFLFTLVVDAFSALMFKANSLSLIEGICVGSDGFTISYLQFANDTICFMKDSEDQVTHPSIYSNSLR